MNIKSKKDKKSRLLEIASAQGGYFTAKQAVKAGYSYRLHHYHKSKRDWLEIERGVFRLANYPNTQFEDLIHWSLWSRNRKDIPQAVFSHETALTVHELGDVMPSKLHFIVPKKFRKQTQKGCVPHKEILLPKEIEQREGFSVTTPLRTIQDMAESPLSLDYLEKIIRDAIRRGQANRQNIQALRFSKKAREKMRLIIEDIKKHPEL